MKNNPVQNSIISTFTIIIRTLKKKKALQRKAFRLCIFKPLLSLIFEGGECPLLTNT